MKANAEIAPELELTPENWISEFGEEGKVETPIGEVKMGENQYFKLAQRGRDGKLGMVKPTLTNPDVIIEDSSEANNGKDTERNSSYLFVKTFKGKDGERYYYFTSVTVRKDGKEVVISNQEKRANRVSKLLQDGSVLYEEKTLSLNNSDEHASEHHVQRDNVEKKEGSLHPNTQSEKSLSLNDSNGLTNDDNQSALLGVNSSASSTAKVDKVSEEADKKQENVSDSHDTTIQDQVDAAAKEVNTEPTEAQKEAGNYKKGHIKFDGYDITIENPKGSVRRGTDADGKAWETEMHNTYGYIRGTEGVDGDHIDVYLSDDPTHGNVFVIDQVNPETGEFDEHKVMYGFDSAEEARNAYLSNYTKDWKGLGNITEVSKEEFKKWIDSSHRKTKPFAEYKGVKAT
ncbi:MAG: hypothetical protein K5854_00100, partial [Prevotella sp.]|nr:hypothetical protein [Prevotella sp.]